MNPETIYLKCSLCDKSHQYQYSDLAFNAIEVDWISKDKNFHLLTSPPTTREEYTVKLHPPLTLNTDAPFWAVYLNPTSNLNGIENEQDLKDIRFCKCEILKIIDSSADSASIEIKVLQTMDVDGLREDSIPDIQWKTLMDDEDSFKRYGTTKNFNSYAYVVVNVESDLGIDAVIRKKNGRSYIVAINQWDFHLNEWILCRIPLTNEDEKKYGVQ